MRRPTVRASRLSGPSSNEFDRGGEPAARRTVEYWCSADHRSVPSFAADVEPPAEWACDVCSAPAVQERGAAPAPPRPAGFHRTPYEFLMMRRTPEEGEQLLAEALAELAKKRSGHA
jgi:hypothetical protein